MLCRAMPLTRQRRRLVLRETNIRTMDIFATNKVPASAQKLRGGYYTPTPLADYLAAWAIRDGNERILEPSCGDGNFIEASLKRLTDIAGKTGSVATVLCAVEIASKEISKAKQRTNRYGHLAQRISWKRGDFFRIFGSLATEEKFDVVIGNPPFIRFQYFHDNSREVAFCHLRAAGYRPTKLANAWAAFVQLSIELLKPGGRLAFVLPAELLQVHYARELREKLTRVFEHIILIGFHQIVFPEIQQEVVLLLAEGKREQAGAPSNIHTLQYKDGHALLQLSNLDQAVSHLPTKHSRNGVKWTALFLGDRIFKALDEAERSSTTNRLGDLVDVDVGIVTGRNSFFVIQADQTQELKVNGYVVPIVGRTSALKSIRFTKRDFQKYSEKYASQLLDLKQIPEDKFSKELQSYIESGEKIEVNLGYKCRIRSRWYDVPSVYIPDAFLFRQIHMAPLLVANRAAVTSTDTIHRVRVRAGIDVNLLCASSINSLTFAWAEVCGRSYGGGVLELEPGEAEELPLPYEYAAPLDIEKIDSLLRAGKLGTALDYTDKILLQQGLGFDKSTIRSIRAAWVELRDRRQNRRRPKAG